MWGIRWSPPSALNRFPPCSPCLPTTEEPTTPHLPLTLSITDLNDQLKATHCTAGLRELCSEGGDEGLVGAPPTAIFAGNNQETNPAAHGNNALLDTSCHLGRKGMRTSSPYGARSWQVRERTFHFPGGSLPGASTYLAPYREAAGKNYNAQKTNKKLYSECPSVPASAMVHWDREGGF